MGDREDRACRNRLYFRSIVLLVALIATGCQVSGRQTTMAEDREDGYVNEVTRISRELDKPEYAGIISAIDFHAGDYPIRTTASHQRFSDSLLNDYLGHFEKAGALVRERAANPVMVYEELGYEMEKAWCNNDVREFINSARNSGDPAANNSYGAFEEMARYCLSRDNKTCPDIDRMKLLPQD